MPATRKQLIDLLRDRDFRGHFTDSQIYELVAAQIKQLRDKHQWTQAELGMRAGMQQVQVSRVENPDYTGSRISTLSKLARALDVALIVQYAPFGELIDLISNRSPASFEPVSFDDEFPADVPLPQADSSDTTVIRSTAPVSQTPEVALVADPEPPPVYKKPRLPTLPLRELVTAGSEVVCDGAA